MILRADQEESYFT